VLISRRDDELQLVTQPDHAAFAGDLARAWGNDRFSSGQATRSLIAAAARHDDGWFEIDAGPAILASEGRPAHFLEVDLTDTVGPYGAGVERLYGDDSYAGVLASRHWAGLYSSRWGVQQSPPVGHPAAQAVVAAEEGRVAREIGELWDGAELRSALEARLWHDYEVLQALDLLSLALCLIDVDVPTYVAAQPIPVPATLRDLVQPSGPRLVPNVPARGGEHLDIVVAVAEPGVVVFDPYPLNRSGIECSITARLLPDVHHDDAARAYHEATPTAVRFTVVAPDA
jgi:hypothetical protein